MHKRFIIFLLLVILSLSSYGQIGISNTNPNNNPTHLIQNVLTGSGVAVSNITFTGNNQQIGYFSNGTSIGMQEGIVMTSGYALGADLGGNPAAGNFPGVSCPNVPNTICNDLYVVANSVPPLIGQGFSVSSINDACILEFDFVPESDTLTFNYCFGSEEYLTWVNSSYNDVFGFFISGPGITGPYSSPPGFPNGSQNIAIVPNSNPALPITISSINPGINSQYYNSGNVTISYNGYTDVFTAMAIVQPCETYHIRLAIADGSDYYLDSGVFLEANSFSSPSVSVGAYGVSIGVDTLTIPCNGTIDLETQISGNYSILWNNGSSANTITVSQGQYYFTATNGSCVLYSDTITVTEQSQFNTSYTVNNVSCYGNSDGSIDLSVSGGISPYNYSWIDSVSGSVFYVEDLSNITSGDYWCLITDANGCSPNLINVVVNQQDSISINLSKVDVSCNGGADGSISLNATGGNPPLSFNWSGPNGFSSNNDTLFGLEAGIYYLTINDVNSCPPINNQISLSEPAQISATYSYTDISCFGANDGFIDLTILGGTSPYSIVWQGPNGFYSNSEDINNLMPGLYQLSIIDANYCLLSSNIQVLINEPPDIIYSHSKINVSCYGEDDGSIDLSLNGGVGFLNVLWTYPSGLQVNSEDLSGLSSGNYSLSIVDANGCSPFTLPSPIFISEPPEIQVSAVIQNEQCYGDGTGTIDITVTNANGPFNYTWTGPFNYTSSTEDIVGLSSGSYQVTVLDNSNLCEQEQTFVVASGAQIQFTSLTEDVSCFEGSDGSINLIQQYAINPTFSWSNGSNNQNINNLTAGTYSVLINDDNNCPIYFTFDIQEPNPINMSSNITVVSCIGGNDGEIELSIVGGTPPYDYFWSNGCLSPINSNLSEGQYVVDILDDNNCVFRDTFLLAADAFHLSAFTSDVNCYNTSNGVIDLSIIGGNYPFTYLWSNGQSTEDLIGLSAGQYTVNVTDANNCTIDTVIIINQPQLITAVINSSIIDCFGANTGSIDIQIYGGNPPYLVDWGSIDTSSLTAGTYFYDVIDNNNCIFSDSFTVVQNDSIAINYIKTDVLCFGENSGSIDLQILQGSGTPPYSYQWQGPNLFSSNNEDIYNLFSGIYIVQVTDANGCTQEIQIVIDEPTPLNQVVDLQTSNYTGYNIACKGDNSGWIYASILGGYPPFNFLWSTGEITDSIYGLYIGNYSVRITDALGCFIDYQIVLNEPPTSVSGYINASTNYNGYNISCYSGNDGAIEQFMTGGVGNYSYEWNYGGLSGPYLFGLEAGYYEVLAYDNNGCLWVDSITLNQPDSLELFYNSSIDTCDRSIGFAEVTVNGGVGSYTYLWNSGQTSSVVDNLTEGQYTITAQDDNQCTIAQNIYIGNLKAPDINFNTLPDRKRYYDQLENPFVFIDLTKTYWQNVINWNWDFGDGIFSSDSITSHSYQEPGSYNVTLIINTEFNCIDTLSKNVTVDEYEIFIPNAFTPGINDNINQEFKPYAYGVESYEMKIYDRWGEIMFETNDINIGWNGGIMNGNEQATSGIYVYFIEIENIYGEVIIYQDSFKLLR